MSQEVPDDALYRGNSVRYWYDKAKVYGAALDAAWKAMTDCGYPPDGGTRLGDAILLGSDPWVAEASRLVENYVSARRYDINGPDPWGDKAKEELYLHLRSRRIK